LDSFARDFFSINDGSIETSTYTFSDVVATLNHIEPYDWNGFLRTRLDAHTPPVDGIAASGWRLIYTDKPSDYESARSKDRKEVDLAYSIGLTLSSKDDSIKDVRWNGPAFKAGVAPGGTLVAVNGTAYKPELLTDAITAAETNETPIALLIRDQSEYKTVQVDHHGGLQYPHLERVAGATDYLSAIIAARK